MTIIAALRHENEIWMASDRETTHYDLGRSDHVNSAKIHTYKHALISTSGMALFKNALKYYGQTNKTAYEHRFESDMDVMDFFFKFHAFMKEKYGLGNAKNDEVERLSGNSFMVVTEEKIYQLSCARDVLVYDNYAAIGNGAEIALGALHVLVPLLSAPEDILRRAVSAGCHFKHGCGGEIDVVQVSAELKRSKKSARKGKTPVHLVAKR